MLTQKQAEGEALTSAPALTRTTKGVPKAQADSKNSITAPVDTTRRRFLTVAAVGSIIGAGSLAAAAVAPNVPQAVTTPKHSSPDPAFVLIADKLAGDIAHCEAIDAEAEAEEHGIGLDEAYDRCSAACHAVRAIDWKLATTLPTTLDGVAAVLRLPTNMKMPVESGPILTGSGRTAGSTSYGRPWRRRSRR